MPFTFAHPAIVLPFNYLSKRWVSLTALVVGSITPDFEYFIRMKIESRYSHTWSGLFWFDIPLGLLLFFIYQLIVKNELIDNLPIWLNIRLSNFKSTSLPFSFQYIAVIILSILIGATSHLLWDGFTHPGGYFVQNISILSSLINLHKHKVYLYKILQHGSTLIGLMVIFLSICQLPIGNKTTVNHQRRFWFTTATILTVTIFVKWLYGLNIHAYGNWIVISIAGGFLGLLTASIFAPVSFTKQ